MSFVESGLKWKSSTMPCLLLTENTKDNPDCLRKIWYIGNNKCYQSRLPQTFGARCWGSACGWIVTSGLDRQLLMVNPFTRATIRLPPQQTVPNLDTPLDDDDEDAEYMRNCFIRKCTVLKDTQSEQGDDYVVLAVTGFWRKLLAFARPGDEKWTSIDFPWALKEPFVENGRVPVEHRAADIACCGARAVILYTDGSLGYLDISDISCSKQPVKAKMFLQGPPNNGLDKGCYMKPYHELYLVESFGDLLLVVRNKDSFDDPNDPEEFNKDCPYKTLEFEVYQLKLETKEWVPINELGDVALFVGDSHSISLRASEYENLKSNCIYFTDDLDEFWRATDLGGHDMGVFDLERKTFEKFYTGKDGLYSEFCPPVWFVPQDFYVDCLS